MHWVFLSYDITLKELQGDLKKLFPSILFSFNKEEQSEGILIELSSNASYLKKRIDLNFYQEETGFKNADILAEFLSQKYECDTVRELHQNIAFRIFNDKFAIQVYAILNRKGKKYIIYDSNIEEQNFEIKIVSELKDET